jgi:hypothetical protein
MKTIDKFFKRMDTNAASSSSIVEASISIFRLKNKNNLRSQNAKDFVLKK